MLNGELCGFQKWSCDMGECVVLCSGVLGYRIVGCSLVWCALVCSAAPCCGVLWCAVLCCAVLCCAVLWLLCCAAPYKSHKNGTRKCQQRTGIRTKKNEQPEIPTSICAHLMYSPYQMLWEHPKSAEEARIPTRASAKCDLPPGWGKTVGDGDTIYSDSDRGWLA